MIASVAEAMRSRGLAPAMSMQTGSEREKRWLGVDSVAFSDRLNLHLQRPCFARSSSFLAQRFPYLGSNDISGVVDVSGFVFSDQWIALDLSARARALRYWSDRGLPLVLLPQAFGPFESPESQTALREIVEASARVYARDQVSFDHVVSTCSERAIGRKVALKPDFTFSVPPEHVAGFDDAIGGVALVPNWNISERISRNAYAANLQAWISEIRRRGDRPFFLCHESGGDKQVVEDLSRQEAVPLVSGLNGRQSKYLLSRCKYAVSGRFHAAISCMSSAVPVFVHGWSHKYLELVNEVGLPELLSDPTGGSSVVEEVISLVDDMERLQATLSQSVIRIKDESERMWDEVADVIEGRITVHGG
ncbi:polysaccharide pyruvyl transferase family protein [Gordonia sp. NPDC057258]|uniref:polysaccharide pyruvyl transferase family protein n=1 Tax=unclassified Gordonia (in: high G+C Gram-positive bacteria) TaxID=2657482 RepID=UPI003638613D